METDKVGWSGPGRQEARGRGLGSVTSEDCMAETDKRKPDERGRAGLGLLLSILHVNPFSEAPH